MSGERDRVSGLISFLLTTSSNGYHAHTPERRLACSSNQLGRQLLGLDVGNRTAEELPARGKTDQFQCNQCLGDVNACWSRQAARAQSGYR